MPIACTRCGNKEDGEIITPPIAFTFKHALGCGHGVGPLAVVKGQVKKPEKKPDTSIVDSVKEVFKKKEEIKVEEKVEEPKPKKNKKETFSQKD